MVRDVEGRPLSFCQLYWPLELSDAMKDFLRAGADDPDIVDDTRQMANNNLTHQCLCTADQSGCPD